MGEGTLRSKGGANLNPRPLAGEGRVRVFCPQHRYFQRRRKPLEDGNGRQTTGQRSQRAAVALPLQARAIAPQTAFHV
jgi:hypothetical protein